MEKKAEIKGAKGFDGKEEKPCGRPVGSVPQSGQEKVPTTPTQPERGTPSLPPGGVGNGVRYTGGSRMSPFIRECRTSGLDLRTPARGASRG